MPELLLTYDEALSWVESQDPFRQGESVGWFQEQAASLSEQSIPAFIQVLERDGESKGTLACITLAALGVQIEPSVDGDGYLLRRPDGVLTTVRTKSASSFSSNDKELGRMAVDDRNASAGSLSPWRRKSPKVFIGLLAVVAVGIGAVAVWSGTGSSRVVLSNAAVVAQDARATLKIDNFGYTFDLGGPQGSATGQGSVDVGNDAVQTSISGLPSGQTVVELRAKETMYLASEDPSFIVTMPKGKQWLSMPVASFDQALSVKVDGFASIDPISALQLLSARCRGFMVARDKPGTLGGARVSYFRVTMSSAVLNACLERPKVSPVVKNQFAAALGFSEITLWVGYDKTHMIRQVQIGGDVSKSSPAGTSGDVINLFSFGGTGIVGAPPANTTLPIELAPSVLQV